MIIKSLIASFLACVSACEVYAVSPGITMDVRQMTIPAVKGVNASAVERLTFIKRQSGKPSALKSITASFDGSQQRSDIASVSVIAADKKGLPLGTSVIASVPVKDNQAKIKVNMPFESDTTIVYLAIGLSDGASLDRKVAARALRAVTSDGTVESNTAPKLLRTGVCVRQAGEDGVAGARIPGIVTAPDGSLLAIFDMRHDSRRDLQGNIDIALCRSTDRGETWSAPQRILDMGCYGGLPEKYNGVSDGCILVDTNTGRIFVSGLWMHGALDDDGRWIEGLNENSSYWIHQWNKRGSQPGLSPKETCQWLITSSDDNGLTWSSPVNITEQTKIPQWWLLAPAPGAGITMSDGTLVFPSQGRDADGTQFSNITYSRDNGKSWTTSAPARLRNGECSVAELSDGTLMLNMRDNRNRGNKRINGRDVFVTRDMGYVWHEHPTSRKALTEPTCMASLYRHKYISSEGHEAGVLLFCNPDHYRFRQNMTLKASFDDGATWPESNQVVFDETRGSGYSSITSVDNDTVGILYESGIADLVFIKIPLFELLKNR